MSPTLVYWISCTYMCSVVTVYLWYDHHVGSATNQTLSLCWVFVFRYRAPECLLTDGYYTHKMDMWSVGCVFFEVLR